MANENTKYVQYDAGEVQSMIWVHDDVYYLDAISRCKEIFGEAVVNESWIALDLKEVFRFKRLLNQKDMEKKRDILKEGNEVELLAQIECQIQDSGTGRYFKNIANYLLGERGGIEVGTHPYNRKMIKEVVVAFWNNKSMVINPCGVRI